MSETVTAPVTATPQSINRFLAGFVALSLLSGITIGMNKILGTLLGLHLGVTPFQLGIIGGAETLALALGTLPAGILIGRGNPRLLYATVSLILTGMFFVLPHIPSWRLVAFGMFAVGLCISFRIVAMSTVFLTRLPEIGQAKAGWYKGTLSLGIQFAGPLIANFFTASLGLSVGFGISAVLFAILAVLGWNVLPDAPPAPKQTGALPARLRDLLRFPVVRTTYLFEVLGSVTASAYGVFAILMAVRILHWPVHLGVLLVAAQGLAYVAVLLGGGRLLNGPNAERWYQAGHLLIVAALLLVGGTAWSPAFIVAAICFGFGLGINGLINFSRLAQAPVDKGRVSSHLTFFQMIGGAFGAMSSGWLAQHIGLQTVFLLWALPWIALWSGWRVLYALLTRSALQPAKGEQS